jgi:TrmH RNA methyltransferase
MKRAEHRRPKRPRPAGRIGGPSGQASVPRAPEPRGAAGGRPRHRTKTEDMFHGVRACAALFAHRPAEIVRVYLEERRRRQFASLLEWCGRERKGFQIVAADNLARLTGATHHEGIAILARQVRRWTLAELLPEIEAGAVGRPVLYLDGVQNPHNLGSILRTAAHFGTAGVLGATGMLPPLSPAAVRVAEGAAEVVPVCDLADPAADLDRLRKAGYRVVVTSSRRGEPLFTARLPERPLIVLGAEGEGVSEAVDRRADLRVRIPGTDAVESLNVSVACGILLGEVWRRRQG